MRKLVSFVLTGASVVAIASAASAQQRPPAKTAAAAPESELQDIIVTARRRSESLQVVPQTVNAVTADSLQKLKVRKFEDVQALVPGLSLSDASNGYAVAASLRGVTFDVTSNAQPTVATYVDDAANEAPFLFQSTFDLSQIEVLKGPQGTNRGIAAPSGAITVTTHRPDLSQFGGYIDTTFTDLGSHNVQGAINIPLIKDVLAVRAAGVYDYNRLDDVRSLNNDTKPHRNTFTGRLSVTFRPSDAFKATVIYQHIDRKSYFFEPVSGPGNPALGNPPITAGQRLAVQDGISKVSQNFDVVTGLIDGRVFGQHVSYIGSYQNRQIKSALAQDPGNILPGVEFYPKVSTPLGTTTQEIRVASDPAPGRFFDYTVGGYYQRQHPTVAESTPAVFLPGAFGPGLGPVDLSKFNPAYQVPLTVDLNGVNHEESLFASVTLHLGSKTELSGGGRHIWSSVRNLTLINTLNGLANFGGIPCAFVGGTNGPGPGDCILNTAGPAGGSAFKDTYHPTIYNASLSHHFTHDFLVYANTGTSFRPGLATIGLQGDLSSSPIPELAELNTHPAEHSTTYEAGFKSTWFGGKFRLNASVFQQRFKNLTIFIPNIQYLNTVTGAPITAGMTSSVNARIRGFDIDAAAQITPEWNLSAQMSYSDGKATGSSRVACNLSDANGNPIFNTGGLISLCPGGSVSRLPKWNATVTSEYVRPAFGDADGFLRVLATYYPANKNRAEPDFTVPQYSLVNLYLGVRDHRGAWEVSIFARNAFKMLRVLDRSTVQLNTGGAVGQFPSLAGLQSGYYETLTTPKREVGINLRYAFGSR